MVIPAATEIPTAFKEKRFLRIGSSKCNMKDYPKREIELFKILDGRTETIETVPAKYQDLTFQKLFGYYGSKGIVLNQKTFIKNLGLKTEEGEFNILAQLLSDNSHFPLRVSIFDGETKGSNLFSVREFGNDCLLYSLDELLRYGDVLNLIQTDETDRVVERKEVPLFDNKAFREAIINAVLHNKWVEGNEPMISVFSDRIEILSRGTLAPAQTMEGFFLGESIPVNEKLSEIFLQLHISEKSGRGVPKITEMYGKDAFSFRENSIVVTIPFERINKVGNKVGKKVGDKKPLNSRRQKIIAEMRDNPNITTAELHNILSSRKALKNRKLGALLDNLQENDILISCEISRLGRSLLEVMRILETCLNKNCQVWTIKENYRLGNDIQSKVLAFAFGLAAEIERNLISERTKNSLQRLKDEGKHLGRPHGFSYQKLKSKHNKIIELLDKNVSKAEIARLMGCSWITLHRYINSSI